MHLHLLVPDLFGPPVDAAGAEPPTASGSAPAAPALETFLARGRKSTQPAASFEAWLLAQFTAADQTPLASAPFALAADGGEPGEQTWAHADPVHLRVERDHLVLVEPDPPLTSADTEALLGTLNDRFDPQQVRFVAPTPSRWYAAIGAMPPLHAEPVARVRGHPIARFLPRGDGGKTWQRLLTEVQMVLHDHPANAARETRGELPINSVWFASGGTIAPVRAPRVQLLCSTLAVARGLAHAAGIEAIDPPRQFDELLRSTATRSGVTWCVLDTLRAPVAYHDRTCWARGLEILERDWFAPALAALRARQLGMITLHAFGPGSELVVETTASDLRYLWRRRRPLHSYVNPSVDHANAALES